MVTRVADLVDVEEGDNVADRKDLACCVSIDAPGLEDAPHAHVARDDRIGYAGEPTMIEVDIRTAHLRGHGFQQHPAGFYDGILQLPDL